MTYVFSILLPSCTSESYVNNIVGKLRTQRKLKLCGKRVLWAVEERVQQGLGSLNQMTY